jgi:hypothetical protein
VIPAPNISSMMLGAGTPASGSGPRIIRNSAAQPARSGPAQARPAPRR